MIGTFKVALVNVFTNDIIYIIFYGEKNWSVCQKTKKRKKKFNTIKQAGRSGVSLQVTLLNLAQGQFKSFYA